MSRLMRLCALAYPRADRTLVLSLAEELVDGGAPGHREAAGLLRAGLEARLRLTGAPWREALGRLGLPLAGLLLAAVLLGMGQSPFVWAGWTWTAGLIGAAAALTGLGSGRRWLALPGAALIAAPEDRLAAAIALAAAAPAACWSLVGAAPTGDAPDIVLHLLLAGLAMTATAVILRLARSAVPRRN